MANSLKTILLATVVIFASINSFGTAGQSQKKCNVSACGKFTVESSRKKKARCVNSKTIYAEKEAPLVSDIKCTLIISRIEKKKKVYFSVYTTPRFCDMQKGEQVELNIRKGAIRRGKELASPCPEGTFFLQSKDDNPPVLIDGKEPETYVDSDVFGE